MGQDPAESDQAKNRLNRLNEGERLCLQLVTRGKVSKEIARDLAVSPHTVDDRLRTACRKLGVRTRFQAAQLLAAHPSARSAPEGGPTSRLRYEESGISGVARASDKQASAGEGNGSDDLDPGQSARTESIHDSAKAPSRLAATSPYAIFFGGENRLSIGQRLLIIAAIAIGIAIAFGGVANGLVELSRLFASP